ncbi:MAG TPA: pentapeptide repeat-containing protein [Methylomirabilota bacterium]|nr:pentapeptide repeat-containing protein [Methylomirabilota bacterium]
MTRGKAKQEFRGRRRPDLPVDPPIADGSVLFRAPEIAIARRTISELKREGLSATSLSIESCVLNRVALTDSTFAAITLRDVRLVECDLANVKTRALTALRVELLDCRMTGFRVEEPAECHDVLISQGLQSYSQFAYASFKSAEFDACNFEDANFLGADLQGCIFRGCNLHNADMRGAKLREADLRGSHVEGLRVNPTDIHGAIVDAPQAMIFAALLGVRIR